VRLDQEGPVQKGPAGHRADPNCFLIPHRRPFESPDALGARLDAPLQPARDTSGVKRSPTTAQVDVENFALVTHVVPAARLRAHVPDRFHLETFSSESGEEHAFVTTTSFCNRQIHWSWARYPAHDFDQMTFRTYVVHKGRRGSYFIGTYVSTRLSFIGQSAVAANSFLADFEIDVRGDATGYPRYSTSATARHGQTSFSLEATDHPEAKHPFTTGEEHAQFITYRLHGFARNPLGFQTYGPIDHRRMSPWSGTLLSGRFDFWERLGVLEAEEFLRPYSVLVEPAVRFTLRPPRPLLS
jgi:uncharacterized protein YqjF (DUF2071 family)